MIKSFAISWQIYIWWLISRPRLIQLSQVIVVKHSKLLPSIYLKNEEHEVKPSTIPRITQSVDALQKPFQSSKNPTSRITLKLCSQVNLHQVVLYIHKSNFVLQVVIFRFIVRRKKWTRNIFTSLRVEVLVWQNLQL